MVDNDYNKGRNGVGVEDEVLLAGQSMVVARQGSGGFPSNESNLASYSPSYPTTHLTESSIPPLFMFSIIHSSISCIPAGYKLAVVTMHSH